MSTRCVQRGEGVARRGALTVPGANGGAAARVQEKNLRFAAEAEPDNLHVQRKLEWTRERLAAGGCSVPSTIGQEKLFNPFMRVAEPALQRYTGRTEPVSCSTGSTSSVPPSARRSVPPSSCRMPPCAVRAGGCAGRGAQAEDGVGAPQLSAAGVWRLAAVPARQSCVDRTLPCVRVR